jgi:glycosyltransferase involved in cell wall biosynthesis
MTRVLFVDFNDVFAGAERSLLTTVSHGSSPEPSLIGCRFGRLAKEWSDLFGPESVAATCRRPYLGAKGRRGLRRAMSALRDLMRVPATAVDVLRMVHRAKIEVIHCHDLLALPACILAGVLARVPVVLDLHDRPGSSVGWRLLRVLTRRGVSIVVSVRSSYIEKAGWTGRLGGCVLPRPVDISQAPEPRPRAPGDAPIVLYLGRLDPQKGVEELLLGAHYLISKGYRFRLRLVGEPSPPYREFGGRLRRLAGPLLEDGSLEMHCWTNSPYEEILACDVVVCPAADEPFGRTIAEGMMLGKVVLCPATTGIAPYVDDGTTGFLTNDGTPSGLAEGLAEVLRRQPQWQSVGAEAARAASVLFAPVAIARRWASVYGRAQVSRRTVELSGSSLSNRLSRLHESGHHDASPTDARTFEVTTAVGVAAGVDRNPREPHEIEW